MNVKPFMINNIQQKKTTFLITLISTLILGLMAHGFVFLNGIFSHDSLKMVTDLGEINWHISLGRFLQYPYRIFRGNITAPWLIGLISLLWIALSAYLIVILLELKSPISQFLTCGVLVTNMSVICINATYIFYIDTFMFALLMSVIGVYFTEKYNYGFIVGSIFVFISLALYQSFFSVSLSLFIMLSVKRILEKKDIKTVIIEGLKEISSLLLGGIIYIVTLKIVMVKTGVHLSDGYNGISKLFTGSFTDLPVFNLISNTYKDIAEFFFISNGYMTPVLVLINIVLTICALICLVRLVYKLKVEKWNILLLVILIALIPFGLNSIFFISQGITHMLMLYAWFLIYPFILFLFEKYADKVMVNKKNNNPFKYSMIFCIVCLIWNSIVYANGAYIKKDLEKETTHTLMTRIIDRMETTDGYIINETPVVFVGYLEASPFVKDRIGFERYTDKYAVGLGYHYAVTYALHKFYFDQQIAYPIKFKDWNETVVYSQNEEVIAMPAFPSKESVKFIGDTLIVKIS